MHDKLQRRKVWTIGSFPWKIKLDGGKYGWKRYS